MRYGEIWAVTNGGEGVGSLLRDVFLRGAISRGDAARILGMPERTARRYINGFIEKNLLASDGPDQPLRLVFSSDKLSYYFPDLFME